MSEATRDSTPPETPALDLASAGRTDAPIPPSTDPAHPRHVPAPTRPKRPRRRSLPLLKRRRLRRKPIIRGVPRYLRATRADYLLGEIAEGAHVVGHEIDARGKRWMVLTISMHEQTFLELCHYGAALEDLEENGDHEPTIEDDGEASVDDQGEPSLGSTSVEHQTRWSAGYLDGGADLELDTADDEPSLGSLGSLSGIQTNWAGGDRTDKEEACDDEGVDTDREPDVDGEPSLGWAAHGGAGGTSCGVIDGEEGFGPSQQTVEAARARWQAKHGPFGQPFEMIDNKGDRLRWQPLPPAPGSTKP